MSSVHSVWGFLCGLQGAWWEGCCGKAAAVSCGYRPGRCSENGADCRGQKCVTRSLLEAAVHGPQHQLPTTCCPPAEAKQGLAPGYLVHMYILHVSLLAFSYTSVPSTTYHPQQTHMSRVAKRRNKKVQAKDSHTSSRHHGTRAVQDAGELEGL